MHRGTFTDEARSSLGAEKPPARDVRETRVSRCAILRSSLPVRHGIPNALKRGGLTNAPYTPHSFRSAPPCSLAVPGSPTPSIAPTTDLLRSFLGEPPGEPSLPTRSLEETRCFFEPKRCFELLEAFPLAGSETELCGDAWMGVRARGDEGRAAVVSRARTKEPRLLWGIGQRVTRAARRRHGASVPS